MSIRNRLQRLERRWYAERIEEMVEWATTLPPADRARLIADVRENLVKEGIIPASAAESSKPMDGP